jgi:hypothetical protein
LLPATFVADRMDATRVRRRLPNPFRRSAPPDPQARSHLSCLWSSRHPPPMAILALPDDVLQLICFHAICQHRTQTWITPADLANPTAQSWLRVCRTFRASVYACVDRFSFFIVKNHVPTQRAASTHAHILRSTLPYCTNLRELQLFVRPRDLYAVEALTTFFAKTIAPLPTIHLCCAPPPLGDSVRDPMPVVTDVIREIASRRHLLHALSLDCCYTIGQAAAKELATGLGPTLQRLALDASLFQDWTVLTSFPNLVELRLQNTLMSDADLRRVLPHLPLLETFAAHQVSSITGAGLEPLARLHQLHTLEFSRCVGIENEAVLALARISSLTTVRLVHIDVSASSLENFVRDMGPRLISLSVNAISTAHASSLSPTADIVLKALLQTVKTHCKNVQNIDFGDSSLLPGNHWSVRPYTEALQHPPPITGTSSLVSTPVHRSQGYRLRHRRQNHQRPISCFY